MRGTPVPEHIGSRPRTRRCGSKGPMEHGGATHPGGAPAGSHLRGRPGLLEGTPQGPLSGGGARHTIRSVRARHGGQAMDPTGPYQGGHLDGPRGHGHHPTRENLSGSPPAGPHAKPH
eukprot:1096351-Alexandrium_andersonii.AAC.1